MNNSIQELSSEQLASLLQEEPAPIVVDVREPWEYEQGHIPGALLIPLGELPYALNQLDADKPVALICESGSRSQYAAALLQDNGFKKIYNVTYGMYGWLMAGMQVAYNREEGG